MRTSRTVNRAAPLSLGTDPLPTLLLRYAVPAIIATTSSSLYNIVDSIFIGRGVGPLAISGLALTMPLMNIASAFGSMVGIGSAAIISIRLGQGDRRAAEQTLGNAVLLSAAISLALSLLGLVFLDDILRLFGASARTIGYSRDFMQVILAGNIVTNMFLSLNEVLRASGSPRKSMAVMLSAVAMNTALNPLFIFVFGWGVRGSAFATVVSQVAALAILLRHFSDGESFLHFRCRIFRLRRRIAGSIVSIGLAPFLVHLCASVVVIFVNKALQHHGGDIHIGAYGVINRIVMLFLMVVSGLNQGMQPIVGYNYGARRYDRVIRALKITAACAVCVTSAGFLVSRLWPREAAGLFVGADAGADAAQLVAAVEHGIRSVLPMFPRVGCQIVPGHFFQYIGKPRKAIFLSMTRQMILLVPLLILLPPHFGTDGVWYAMPIADTSASVLAAVLLFLQLRRMRRNPDAEKVL
ncbi:MAG: MATE family efflux transporter [Alistipes sp.]|nr:MATE family efflux transporter [Alistipes sp.]